YPRASTPHRSVDCYHPAGASGAAYMPSTAGATQPAGQPALRVQQPPQPSAPPAPPQDMSKNTMGGHSFVSPPNQTPQTRPQYGGNFQYRPTQHATRPNTHPRQQQQQFMPSQAAPSGAGTVMYHPVVFQSMGMQTYQQPRSNTQGGYYPYMTASPYLSYSNTPSHTSSPYYFTSNNQPLPTPNIQQANAPGGRSNAATLVGPQGAPATPATPAAATLAHHQGPSHIHQNITGVRPTVPPAKRPSYRLAIINPLTKQDILSEIVNSNDNNQYMGGDSSGRQTPQQEQQQQPTRSVAEEFARKVNEVANQPTLSESAAKSKCIDVPIHYSISQINTITSINNSNIGKSEIVSNNENKNLGADIAVAAVETPVVSAISDSPVIVPKMPKQQKTSEQSIQSFILDTNKISTSKQNKHKSKPFVPHVEDIEKATDSILRLQESVIPLITQVSICPVTTLPLATMTISTPATMSAVPKTTNSLITPHLINAMPAPQPQRIREHRSRLRPEDREKSKDKDIVMEKDIFGNKANGPAHPTVTSSVDSFREVINPLTSQSSINTGAESTKRHIPKQFSFPLQTDRKHNVETKTEALKSNKVSPVPHTLTATELLSASIEKLARGHTATPEPPESEPELKPKREFDSAIEAQVKLTQSLASCLRASQPESKMKDFNLNNKATDSDAANGNTELTKPDSAKEDYNKNEKTVKNNKIKNAANEMYTNDNNVTDTDSQENGKDETDKISSLEQNVSLSAKEDDEVKPLPASTMEETVEPVEAATPPPPAPPVFVPKYKYNDDQWSPLNKTGKKCYDIGLLKQIKDDPLSKNKPNVPLLEACHIIRTAPMQEPIQFAAISRAMNDSLFLPSFANKGPGGMGSRNNTQRDPKKDGRNIIPSGKNSIKLAASQSSNSSQKQVIHVSLSLREEVKLNQVDSAWKPSRLRKENTTEEDCKTQEVYKKFRGILNKLTPQKFDTLLEKVKTLEITNQKRLEGVIDLVFEKAIDEPNFSEAYAAMCNKLATLKVPAENATNPDQRVDFRVLIISRCQKLFETDKMDDNVLKLEKEILECTDPIMNATPLGNFRRDDGGRGKRNDGRRQGSNSFMDSSNWKSPRNSYTVDTSKLKAGGAATPKNLNSIKLAPINLGWTQGSGTKNTAQTASNSMISLTKNMYGILENAQTDPTSLRGNKDMPPAYHSKGASIERSTFNTRADFSTNSGNVSRSGSVQEARSNSGSRSASTAPPTPPASEASTPTAPSVPQKSLPDARKECKSPKDVPFVAMALTYLITTHTISADNYLLGLQEIMEQAPDLYIDIPMLYDYLGKFIAPQIEKKHATLKQIFRLSKSIISSNHGHLLLKVLIRELKDSMGPTFVKSKWLESELQLKEWMSEDQIAKWIEENKFEFLDTEIYDTKTFDESSRIMTPSETQKKLLQLMNAEESCDCIKGWVQDILGKSSNEDWFMRALIQAICEHALFGAEGRDVPHFNQERMNKYAGLINEFGDSKEAREASCLFGIQQLIHRLVHPQGLTLDIFQYLHEQYIITVDGFIAWEESEKEPEGKGVMMKALTSFFTNIKEADNEDSCSED
ncbi:hypothetical protein ACJJTC_000928, partial [Scirpophaga incertulas]